MQLSNRSIFRKWSDREIADISTVNQYIINGLDDRQSRVHHKRRGFPAKSAALFHFEKGGAFLFFYLIRLLPRRSAYFVSPHA